MAKTKADPTGQMRAWKRAGRALKVRLNRSQAMILRLFRDIPRTRRQKTDIRNAEARAIYDYDLSVIENRELDNQIQFILNEELLESQDNVQPDWYWIPIIEQPYRAGTAEEIVQFNQMITAGIISGVISVDIPPAQLQPEQILTSRPYRQGLGKTVQSNFTTLKGLSQTTSKQVIQQINLGIEAGDTPTAISKAIQERFNVAKSSADRIARTEVNKAFNDAKIQFNDLAAERTGLRAGVIHISALTTTTRASHAARHGNAYTTAQQQQWWNTGSNRINCLCTTQSVLIDAAGKVVDTALQEEVQAERSFFDEEGIL